MRLEKDHEYPNLYYYPKAGTYYFRKFITGVGEVFRSLREKNRYKAVVKMNRLSSEFERLKKTRTETNYTIDDAILELYDINQMKAQATFQNFEHFCRAYITPYYSGTPIDAVAEQWDLFKADVKKKRPGMSLAHLKRHTTRILRHAVKRGKLKSFPELTLDAGEAVTGTPRAYDPDEVTRALTAKPDSDHRFKKGTVEKQRLMLRLTLELGLRPPQEIRMLKKEYFDFARGLLVLPAWLAKTRRGRTVPINAPLVAAIQEFGAKNPSSPYLFPMRGNPDKPASRSDKSWQRLKRALGFEGKRYWFRHSHATAALEGGEDARILARDMGTSVEMLAKIYARPGKDATDRRLAAVQKKYGVQVS